MKLRVVQPIKQYTFYWSPEGRKLGTYIGTLRQCRAQFKREFPGHAKFMGEVYRTETDVLADYCKEVLGI